jgi:hypothetical protein
MQDIIWTYVDYNRVFKGIWDSTRNYIDCISDM